MNNNNHIRQGDVGISKIETHNFELKEIPINGKRIILAEGEATGHHHSIVLESNPKMKFYDVVGQPQTRLLYIPDSAVELEHQEHGTITLEPGLYQIEIQVEYDPEGERRVRD